MDLSCLRNWNEVDTDSRRGSSRIRTGELNQRSRDYLALALHNRGYRASLGAVLAAGTVFATLWILCEIVWAEHQSALPTQGIGLITPETDFVNRSQYSILDCGQLERVERYQVCDSWFYC